jgi:hypothetical protein
LCVFVVVVLRSSGIAFVSVAAVVVFVAAITFMPEFECRHCHHRWTSQPDADAFRSASDDDPPSDSV